MSIETLHRVQCDGCERYLGCSRPAVTDSDASPFFVTHQSAQSEASRKGWVNGTLADEIFCPDCKRWES